MWLWPLIENASSKLLDVVSVADVDAEESVDVHLVEIMKLRFGRFWKWILVTILKLKFGQDFEVYFWPRVWGWDLVKILKLNFGQDIKAEARPKILKLNIGQVVKTEVWSRL